MRIMAGTTQHACGGRAFLPPGDGAKRKGDCGIRKARVEWGWRDSCLLAPAVPSAANPSRFPPFGRRLGAHARQATRLRHATWTL